MTFENQSIDNVSKKILNDANEENERIINEAHKKEKEILTDAEAKRIKILENAKEQAKESYKKTKELVIAAETTKLCQESLLNKIKLIDEISEKALKKIKFTESNTYLNFIKESIKSLKITEAQYQIGKNEKIITSEIIKKVSEGAILKLSDKPADFENGIKIIDGKKQYIISIEEVLKEKIDDIRMEISDFLFERE